MLLAFYEIFGRYFTDLLNRKEYKQDSSFFFQISIYMSKGWMRVLAHLRTISGQVPTKAGHVPLRRAQGLFSAYLQGSESSALLRGMCPPPGFEKWDRHIPLRSYGDLRTNLLYIYRDLLFNLSSLKINLGDIQIGFERTQWVLLALIHLFATF